MTFPVISIYKKLSFCYPALTGVVEDVQFNYCLLLSKTGRLSEASNEWLMCGEGKAKLTSKAAGIEMLREERSHYQTTKENRSVGYDRERHTVLMNTAMLQYWTQHCSDS